MKTNKTKIAILVGVVVLIICAIFIFTGKKYTLVIKDTENITTVLSQKNTSTSKIEISSKTLINEIITAISNERVTKNESKTETPTADEYYTITFNGTNQKIYMYTLDGKFYIEEPLNGIYEIPQEEYDKIMRYLVI